MTWSVWLNEVDLSTLGLYVESLDKGRAAPARSYQIVRIPGRMGGVVPGDPITSERQISISGTIDPPLRTVAQRQSFEDQLKAVAYRGLIRLTVDDDVNAPRCIDALGESLDVTPIAHPMVTQLSRVSFSVKCPDPTWYDVTAQVISLPNSVAVPIPLGDAPIGGLIRIGVPAWSASNVTNPQVNYYTTGGVSIGTLAFTMTLTAGTDYLEIDLDRQTAVKVSSGVRTNAIANLTSGDFFVLDPTDCDPLNGNYPSLIVGGASGTCSGTWTGVRRWL